jgi:ribonuclease H2 subunit C
MVYLRGRKLEGKTVKLPEQCRGVILQRKDEPSCKKPLPEPDVVVIEDEEDQLPETGTMQVTAEFDEMVVWGHEAVADASSDPYVRSMEEWLQISDKVSLSPLQVRR